MASCVDWRNIDIRIVEYLSKTLMPVHYRELYKLCAVDLCHQMFSDNTDPAEKLRQRYGNEHDHPTLINIGGYIWLKYWLMQSRYGYLQAEIFATSDHFSVCTSKHPLSFVDHMQIFDEMLMRFPYMADHFNDADCSRRIYKRFSGFLIERYISEYFRKEYPEFWRKPSNHDDYKKPSTDDFQLLVGGKSISIDVKQVDAYWQTGLIRNPHRNVVYIFGEPFAEDGNVYMVGFQSGWQVRDLMSLPNVDGKGLLKIEKHELQPIQRLLVWLNIQKEKPDSIQMKTGA